ncbi:MAG: aspartate/glutamate racemase family protein [Burkholderiales bacterium]
MRPAARARPGRASSSCHHKTMLGILTLDTAFPRIPGDVGCPETFGFPVRYATVSGATPEEIVHRGSDALLPRFIRAADELVEAGCTGIATTCGFLARWQRELAAELSVPVLTSTLLLVPLVARMLPAHRKVGVVTYSAIALTPGLLESAGAPPYTPAAGVDPLGYFSRTVRHGSDRLDSARMSADVVDAARHLVAQHQDLGAIVLECANMPPYRDAVVAATELPVFDAAQLLTWFHGGIAGSARRHARHNLW